MKKPIVSYSSRSWAAYVPFLGTVALALATIIFLLLTIAIGLFMNMMLDHQVDRTHWTKTQGVCIGHDGEQWKGDISISYGAGSSEIYWPVLLYSYAAPNATATMEGRGQLYLKEEFSSVEAAKAGAERTKKLGDVVTVYYNPDIPTESTLDAPTAPGSLNPFFPIASGVTSILALGSLLTLVFWRRWWQTRELAEGSGVAILIAVVMGAFGLPTVIAGLGFMSAGAYTSWQAASAKRWQPTQGQILSHDIHETQMDGEWSYHPKIRYSYQADRPRESDSIFIGSMTISYETKSEAKELLNEFPVGSQVEAYYDPKAPNRSALILETAGGEWIAIVMGGMTWPIGLFCLIVAILTAKGGIKVVRKPL